MPRKSCNPCSVVPDNCFSECVKCSVEKCKKLCCERKYLKLAHKLLDSGLFVDSANYDKAVIHDARTSTQFNNIVNAFADNNVEIADLQPGQPVIVNNQPNNLLSFEKLGFDAIEVLEFTLTQLTSYSNLSGDFTFIMEPKLTLLFGVDITDVAYSTLKAAIVSATPSLTNPGSEALLTYLTSLQTAVSKILKDVLPGGLTQVLLAVDTPYVTDTDFFIIDPTDDVKIPSPCNGKAALVSKLGNESSPITTEDTYFLAISARRVVDKYAPHIPPVC